MAIITFQVLRAFRAFRSLEIRSGWEMSCSMSPRATLTTPAGAYQPVSPCSFLPPGHAGFADLGTAVGSRGRRHAEGGPGPDRQAGGRNLRLGRKVQPGQHPPPEGTEPDPGFPEPERQGAVRFPGAAEGRLCPGGCDLPGRRSQSRRRVLIVEEPRRLQQEDGADLAGE